VDELLQVLGLGEELIQLLVRALRLSQDLLLHEQLVQTLQIGQVILTKDGVNFLGTKAESTE
jgi:hypothetical protein